MRRKQITALNKVLDYLADGYEDTEECLFCKGVSPERYCGAELLRLPEMHEPDCPCRVLEEMLREQRGMRR